MLARNLYATGADDAATKAYEQASASILKYAESLKPDHAAVFLAAEPVKEVLRAGRRTDGPPA